MNAGWQGTRKERLTKTEANWWLPISLGTASAVPGSSTAGGSTAALELEGLAINCKLFARNRAGRQVVGLPRVILLQTSNEGCTPACTFANYETTE